MRKWRNRQTRTFEGRVVHTVRVQVPFSAPKKSSWAFRFDCFSLSETGGEGRVLKKCPGDTFSAPPLLAAGRATPVTRTKEKQLGL